MGNYYEDREFNPGEWKDPSNEPAPDPPPTPPSRFVSSLSKPTKENLKPEQEVWIRTVIAVLSGPGIPGISTTIEAIQTGHKVLQAFRREWEK